MLKVLMSFNNPYSLSPSLHHSHSYSYPPGPGGWIWWRGCGLRGHTCSSLGWHEVSIHWDNLETPPIPAACSRSSGTAGEAGDWRENDAGNQERKNERKRNRNDVVTTPSSSVVKIKKNQTHLDLNILFWSNLFSNKAPQHVSFPFSY